MAIRSGEDFEFISFIRSQIRIDTPKVKELLGRLQEAGHITPAEYTGCFKELEMNFLQTSRKDPAKKQKFTPPVLDNVTIVGLVDMLGDTREKIAVLKKEEGYYKERIKGGLITAGDMAPSEAPPMPEWLKLKLAAGDDGDE